MVSETITSKSYILGVQKTNLIPDVYTIFFNQISNNVTDPNVTHPRKKWIFPSWPEDFNIESGNSYPIIVIDSPDQNAWEKITFRKKKTTIVVTIEVYSTSMKELDSLSQQVINALESIWKTFKFIKVNNINLASTSIDHFIRGKLMIHNKTIKFDCNFEWSRT